MSKTGNQRPPRRMPGPTILDSMHVVHETSRTYRIEKREVFVVCTSRPPEKYRDLFSMGVRLKGDSWTDNGEEMLICDNFEAAQTAMRDAARSAP